MYRKLPHRLLHRHLNGCTPPPGRLAHTYTTAPDRSRPRTTSQMAFASSGDEGAARLTSRAAPDVFATTPKERSAEHLTVAHVRLWSSRIPILCGHPWTGVGPIAQSGRWPGRPCHAQRPSTEFRRAYPCIDATRPNYRVSAGIRPLAR
jgi:hypothetical protein